MAFQTKCWVSFLTTALKPCRILLSLFSSTFCGLWTCQILNGVLLLRVPKASNYQSRFLFEDKCFFWKKTISLSFFRFFCTLGKRLPHFGRKRLGNLLQFALCVSRKSFWKKTSWKKLPSTFVLTLGRTTFPDFQQSFLDLHFINFIFFLEQNVELKICLKIRVYSFSHFCTWGFRTSDKWVESVFSQLP